MTAEKLLDAIKKGKAIFGASVCMKHLRKNEIEAIFLASNCPSALKEQIRSLAELNKVPVHTLSETNEELAILCEKNFSIAVAGILKKEKE